MKLHLDNAAATKVNTSAIDAFSNAAEAFFANQEGSGLASKESADAIAKASKSLSQAIAKASNADVLWLNTGTDALTSAVDAAMSFRAGTIVCGDVEHASLAKAVERAGAAGHSIRKAKIGPDGQFDLRQLESLLDDGVALVALHHVHAETGAIQQLQDIRRLLDAKAPKALFLSDTTQSALKLEMPWESAKLDFATISGAKVGAPCGAALLYRDDAKRLLGKRVLALRAVEHKIGRCPPAACVALAHVAQELSQTLSERLESTQRVKSAFRSEIGARLGDKVRFTLSDALSSPYILHMLIPGTQGATLVRMLAEKGFTVSAGSACEAEVKSPSKALLAMGVPRAEAYSALRLSFWSEVEESHAAPFAEALADCVKAY